MSPALLLCRVLWPWGVCWAADTQTPASSSDFAFLLDTSTPWDSPQPCPQCQSLQTQPHWPATITPHQPPKDRSLQEKLKARSQWLLSPVLQGPLCPGGQGLLPSDPADQGSLASHDPPTSFQPWHHVTLSLWL